MREKERERRHTPNLILSGSPVIATFAFLPLTENLSVLFSFSSLRRSASRLTISPACIIVLVAKRWWSELKIPTQNRERRSRKGKREDCIEGIKERKVRE